MTYTEYWQAVMGPRSAGRVVVEFGLTDARSRDLDEWLGTAEEGAVSQCTVDTREAFRASCEEHHATALDELTAAIDAAIRERDAAILERDCPTCDAGSGEACEDVNGNPWAFFHDTRKS